MMTRKDLSPSTWAGKAAIAGATVIGSAALAAALLWVKRKDPPASKAAPPHPEQAPETD
jgi:hypothetical protein